MDSYSIDFKPSVEKDLQRLPRSVISRVMRHIEDLRSDPFPHQVIELSGAERLFRIRVQAKQIIIHYVRHRREVYRAL